MSGRWSVGQVLLGIVAVSLVVGTVLALGIGLDLFVAPPDLADSLDLPGRIDALRPYNEAIWPFDAASNLAFIVAFGALALASGPIADLGRPGQGRSVLRAAILTTGILGVAADLLYIGATNIAVNLAYCDCGFKTEESIAQLWAINVFQGGQTWLSYGAIVVGAIAIAGASMVIPDDGRATWRWLSWIAAILLVVGIVLTEFAGSDVGRLVTALATGIVVPIWAVMLAPRLHPGADPAPA